MCLDGACTRTHAPTQMLAYILQIVSVKLSPHPAGSRVADQGHTGRAVWAFHENNS